jgi:hypothetical protein
MAYPTSVNSQITDSITGNETPLDPIKNAHDDAQKAIKNAQKKLQEKTKGTQASVDANIKAALEKRVKKE